MPYLPFSLVVQQLMKFHVIIHLMQDILLYGVPSEVDTGSNESHHKPSKYAAKLTQRNESTFNFQTAKRLTEFLMLDHALAEVLSEDNLWEYFDAVDEVVDWRLMGQEVDSLDTDERAGEDADLEALASDIRDLSIDHDVSDVSVGQDDVSGAQDGGSGSRHSSDSEPRAVVVYTGGTQIEVFLDPDDNYAPSFKVLGRSKSGKDTTWGLEIITFLNELQNVTMPFLPNGKLPVRTEHKRDQQIYHGHPNFRGKGFWRDWVLVDWGGGSVLPAHIWCFVVLSNMPKGRNQRIEFGGINLEDGVFAVVESANYDDDEDGGHQSDLFTPLTLEVEGIDQDGDVSGRKFYLADTEAFVGPCILIPDIGGPPNAYFQVKNRSAWAAEFVNWLKKPHTEDVMEYSDEEKDDQDEEANASDAEG